MPSISVILPCYNVASVVGRCLESIEKQTIPIEQLEIICINDGSTDNTFEVLHQWEKMYPDNIMIVNLECNMKPGYSRNLGLSYASSKWIAFVDSDDWIEQDYLEKMYVEGESRDCDVVACQFSRDDSEELNYFSQNERVSNIKKMEYIINSEERKKDFFHCQPLKLYAWAKLIKTDFLIKNNILFPEGYAYEDILWGNLVHLYADRAYVLDEKLYHYYINPDSIVLKKNVDYHMDHLTIQEMMWNDWINRGLIEKYRYELEYEYLYNGYLGFLKIISYRYDIPNFSLFQLLQTLTCTKLSYSENPYFMKESLPEFHKQLLDLSAVNMNRNDFENLIESIRRIGL